MAETRAFPGFRSGEVARRTGVSADTLRHYERRGLLAKPRRRANGYRVYPPAAVDRVLLIQRALGRTDGSVSDAAKILGLSRSALYRRLQQYGLKAS